MNKKGLLYGAICGALIVLFYFVPFPTLNIIPKAIIAAIEFIWDIFSKIILRQHSSPYPISSIDPYLLIKVVLILPLCTLIGGLLSSQKSSLKISGALLLGIPLLVIIFGIFLFIGYGISGP